MCGREIDASVKGFELGGGEGGRGLDRHDKLESSPGRQRILSRQLLTAQYFLLLDKSHPQSSTVARRVVLRKPAGVWKDVCVGRQNRQVPRFPRSRFRTCGVFPSAGEIREGS